MKVRVGLLIVALLMLVLILPVMAQQPQPFDSPIPGEEFPPLPDVDTGKIDDYIASLGLGSVVMVVIEILKQLKVVPDGQAGRWATLANIVLFAVLAVAGVFGVNYAGDTARMIFDVLNRIGQVVLAILASPIFFKGLRMAQVLKPQAG